MSRAIHTPSEEERIKNINRVERARLAFEDLYSFYHNRERNFRYGTGEQWSDMMVDPETNETITEKEYIERNGRLAAVQNQIGKTIRNLAGQFRSNYPDPVAFSRTRANAEAGEMMTQALQYALDLNEGNELDAENMREYAVSGACGWKVSFKWRPEVDRKDVLIDSLNMTRFFYNIDARDIRGTDITICGELHDLSIYEVISKFGFNYEKDLKRVKAMFPDATSRDWQNFKEPEHVKKFRDFYIPDNPDKVRVIELWVEEFEQLYFLHDSRDGSEYEVDKDWFIEAGYPQEIIDLYSLHEIVGLMNQQRQEEALKLGVPPESIPVFTLTDRFEPVWNCYYLTPNGDLLLSMRTPYAHQSHPYIFGRYMMDGKIISMVETIIDQQRHINRLISFVDAYLGGSLKNVMMIAEESVPARYKGNFAKYTNDIVKMNQVVYYSSGSNGTNPIPKEISSKSMPVGAMELLNLQMDLLKDLSAVNDAIQGNAPHAGTPASLYAQQTINASITNKDIFDFYFSLIRKRNRKVVQVIKQFYEEPRFIKVSGVGSHKGVEGTYDPTKVEDIDFDVVIGESQNTLAYRQVVDDDLKGFLQAQLITFEEFLKLNNKPYSDKLLQIIGNRQAPAIGGTVSPDGAFPGQEMTQSIQ